MAHLRYTISTDLSNLFFSAKNFPCDLEKIGVGINLAVKNS